MKRNKLIFALVFLCIFVPTGQIQAAFGTPSAHLAVPSVLATSEYNPALVGATPYGFQLEVDLLGLNLWTNAWTFNQIAENINSYWDDEIKAELLGAIRGNSFKVGTNLRSGLYLGIGKFTMASRLKGDFAMGLDKNFFDIILNGLTIEGLDLNLTDTFATSNLLLDNSISYSFALPSVAANLGWQDFQLGAGLHYIYGLAWGKMKPEGDINLKFNDEDYTFHGNGKAQALYSVLGMEGGGGHGFAVDLGAWAQYNPKLSFGLSLTNLGAVRWDGVSETSYQGDFTIRHPLSISDDEDPYEFDGEEVLNQPHDPVWWMTPMAVKGSIHYVALPRIHLLGAAGYNAAPTHNFFASAGTRFFYPKFLPLTVTLDYESHKGTLALSTSLGLHIGGWEVFNLTLSDIKLAGGQGKEISLFFNTALRF